MKFRVFFLAIFFICFYNSAYPQTNYSVVIKIPPNVIKENLNIVLRDGKTSKTILSSLKKDSIFMSGIFFGKYASVSIGYYSQKDSSFFKSFFIYDKGAQIDIKYDTLKKQYSFKVYRAIDEDSVGGAALKKFAKSENDSLKAFVNSFNGYVPGNVENAKKIETLNSNIGAKELLFVSEHSNLYFSLTQFKDVILPHRVIVGVSMDSLRRFYDKYFSKRYANTYEDKFIQNVFYDMTLSVGKILPEFIVSDVNKKLIDLRKIKSKYILLDFWAGWCAPCVREIPFLNNIRKKYPSDFLEFVYVSQDASKTAETIASSKYKNIYGLHVLSNNELITKFNASAIPKTYLVDRKTGEILYLNSDNGIEDVDQILKRLFTGTK